MTVMMTMMMTRFDRGLPILMMSLMMKIAPQNAPVLPLSICKVMCQNHGLSNNDSKKQLKNLLKIIRKVEKTSPAFSRQIDPSTSFQIQPERLSFLASPLRMLRRRQCRISLCSRFSLRRSHSASSSPIMTQPYLKSFPNLLLCLLSYLPAVSVQDGRPSPISDIFSRFETFSPKVSSCAASHECMAPAPPCAPRSGLFTSPFHIIWRQLCHQ